MIRGILIVWLLGACAAPMGPAGSDAPSVQPEASVRASVLPEAPRTRAARVVVASVQIDLRLSEGTLIEDVPEGAAFVLEGTVWPCDQGTSYVYSHARRGMFLSLWDVRLGDRVSLNSPGSGVVCEYEVTEIHRVEATDVSWFTYAPAARTLVLQTSLGPNPSYGEFVVVAEGSSR